MKCRLPRVLCLLTLALAAPLAPLQSQSPAAPMRPGIVLVAMVAGTVTMTVNGQSTSLQVDDSVPPSAMIHTGAGASIVLVFSNGATALLDPESELILEQFTQDPFGGNVRIADLEEEPSASRTALTLSRGGITATVKRLKRDRQSWFGIKTPFGTADTQGGICRILLRPADAGQTLFRLSANAGTVGFTPQGEVGGADPAEPQRREVRPGQEITWTTTGPKPGQITPLPPASASASPWTTPPPNEPPEGIRPVSSPARTSGRPQIVRANPARPALLTGRPAGTTNIGPTAVDAKWSRFGAYLQRMIDAVQIQWERNVLAQRASPLGGSSVVVKFVINDEGRIVDIGIENSSANEAATRACLSAITARMPYGPWTADMKAALGDKQEMTFTFFYQ